MRRYKTRIFASYAEQSKAALLSPASGRVLQLHSINLLNRSGGAADLGVLKKYANADWEFGTVSDASSPDLTDQTAAIQAGNAVNVFTTTVNDGFLVQSTKRFSLIGITLTQAQTGAPVYAVEYYNGTAFVPVPQLNTRDLSTIGDKLYLFAAPMDWALGGPAGVGVDADKYAIRIRATTAGGQAVIANAAWVGELLGFQTGVPQDGGLALNWSPDDPERFEALEALLPYFSVASANNLAAVQYFHEA